MMTRNKWVRIALRLLLLSLLPLLGFGAVKGYYWYQVRAVVEQLAQQVSLLATLEYDSIETGFDGVAGVRHLVLTPLGQKQGVTIDAVRVEAPSWLDLVFMQRQLDSGELPQSLRIALSGIRIDLAGAGLNQLAAQALADDAAIAPGMLGCEAAAAGLSGVQWLQKLGYQQLTLDVAAEYRFDRSSKLLTFSYSQAVQDQFAMELSAALDLGINELNRYNLGLISPSLGDLNLHYQDRSFNRRAVQFCAAAIPESAEQFVDRHLGLISAGSLELGLSLPPSLLDGYRQFLLGAGELRLELLGGSQLRPAAILQNSPDQLLTLLAPKLTINGQRIEPLSVLWQPTAGAAEPLQQVRNNVEAFASLLQAPFVEPPPETAVPMDQALLLQPPADMQGQGFRATALDQLHAYLGMDLRIETNNGNLIEGRLLTVELRELRIYQEVGMGDAVLPIAFKHVKTVLVYR